MCKLRHFIIDLGLMTIALFIFGLSMFLVLNSSNNLEFIAGIGMFVGGFIPWGLVCYREEMEGEDD